MKLQQQILIEHEYNLSLFKIKEDELHTFILNLFFL